MTFEYACDNGSLKKAFHLRTFLLGANCFSIFELIFESFLFVSEDCKISSLPQQFVVPTFLDILAFFFVALLATTFSGLCDLFLALIQLSMSTLESCRLEKEVYTLVLTFRETLDF